MNISVVCLKCNSKEVKRESSMPRYNGGTWASKKLVIMQSKLLVCKISVTKTPTHMCWWSCVWLNTLEKQSQHWVIMSKVTGKQIKSAQFSREEVSQHKRTVFSRHKATVIHILVQFSNTNQLSPEGIFFGKAQQYTVYSHSCGNIQQL